jgi:hypothetical protein
LKEAVDDLEWPGGSVVVRLTRDPVALRLVQTHKNLVPHPLLGVRHMLRKWCCAVCALQVVC